MTIADTETESRESLTASQVAEYLPEMIPILDGRAETAWAAADLDSVQSGFAAERFLAMPGLLSGAATSQVANYYRRIAEARWMVPAPDPERLVTANDPVGRALLRQFLPIVQAIVGGPIRESYTFTADYLPGAALPMHVDRLQCEYTISLFLDYGRLPVGEHSPWSLDVALPLHAEPLRFYQTRGEGILFKGRDLPHGRPVALEHDRCLVIMLHYVDADFPDEQMEPD
jgi:hypothetical protein